MFLVKTLKLQHRDAALKCGKIRIGTINYYRAIEDAKRRDAEEGLGHIIWKGSELSAEDHKRIFTPFDGVELGEGWTIKNFGVPIHGSYPNFNAYAFCYSLVKNTNEIAATSGGKAKHYYFIADLSAFVRIIADGLRPVVESSIRQYEPEKANELIKHLEVKDATYRVHYSDESKARIVNEENVSDFNPKTFYPQDFFQKRTSFVYEKEVRTIWLFWSKDDSGNRQLLQLPHPDKKHEDLELGRLPISKKRRRNRYNVKVSNPKPDEA